ncbi:hypothetical protein [Microbacterium rhizosphaerae]|uniref:Uncharacterized protein n=1 Tax=Microbacterium rhizosphaerae TaxID=1678237 RepID=A0ABZ0SJV2_9MICO|nr:hypothetical protein [Microbacterium rhizosphaerae]WPR89169.1 hypothetical protein SM116_15605 [Microbacterium rhizosphaerae]
MTVSEGVAAGAGTAPAAGTSDGGSAASRFAGRRGTLLRSRFLVAGSVSGVVPRAAVVVVAAAAFAFMDPPYAVIAVALAVVGAFAPGSLGTWGCALVIGLAPLARPADAADWRPYATLAIVHLLQVLGGLTMVVPWRSRMQVRVLRRPLVRWVLIQVPAQALLAAVLFASASLRGVRVFDAPTAALFAIVAAACVGLIAVVLTLSSPRR